ncbi:MAG: LamG-like jellyroll fold domain-containing protein [Bacteroidaceae bacterium]
MRKKAFSAMMLLLLSMVWNVQPVSAQLYEPDFGNPLITNVVADPTESQLTSNCTWKITDPNNDNYPYNAVYIDAGNELGALIDGDQTTYWHSDPTGANLKTQDLYIQVDLKRTDINQFFYVYDRRADVYQGSVRRGIMWTKIEIMATNTPEDNSSWVTIATHDNLPAETVEDVWPYTAPVVVTDQPYRYLRFYARNAGQAYWCFSEFQMYPAVEVTDPLQLLISLVDSTDPGVFTAGTDPGYYDADKIKAFAGEWDKASKLTNSSSATDEELTAARESLSQALEEVKASRVPVTDGYYRIVSSNEAFFKNQGVEKAMYGKSDENRMAWQDLDEESPYQVFKITQLPSGNFSIQCVGNAKYIDWVDGDARYTAAAYVLPIVDEQKTEQTILPDDEYYKPWFRIQNVKNSCSYHMLSHANGDGTSGYICAAEVGYNQSNYWYLYPVDNATGDALMEEGLKKTYAELLSKAVEKAEAVRKKANDYEVLIFEADDEDDAHNQFSSNARWTYKDAASGGQGAYANLIDGSSDTYFHSVYPPQNAVGFHYLQVDLKRTDISEFIFKMLRRGDGGWRDSWNQLPCDIDIWVTNDASAVEDPTPTTEEEEASSAWKKVINLNSGFPSISSREYYTSPIIEMGGNYQYVRFVSRNTVSNTGYFNMSEFQMYGTVPTASSEYNTVPGMKEVCDQLDAEIAKAKEKIENQTALREDTAIINQLARQINELYVDRTGINYTLNSYLTLASATYKTAFAFDDLLVDGDQENGQILCNTPEDGFTYASLLDGNLSTYFQSKHPGAELNKSATYLEFDLRRNDLSTINFEFYGIASGYQNPNAIDVYVSKDASDDTSWKRLIGLTDGFDTNKPNAHYVSPDIDLKDTYQYIRLYPTSSPTSDWTINLAEIQFHSTIPSTEKSQYYYVEGLKDAADKLKDVIDRVQDKVNKGMAIDLSDTTAINEAAAAVKALVINPAEYKTMAADVEKTLSNPYNIGNCIGQYPAEAVTALKAVLEQTNAMVNYDKPEREAFDNATKLLSEAQKTFEESRIGVNTGMWYTIRYPNLEYFEYRGWTEPSWWIEGNYLYDQYLVPGLRTEDAAEILSDEDVAIGDKVYFFDKEDAENEPTAAQWRFVEIGKGKYALQNRRSGLFIYSGTENNSSSMQLTPSTVRVEPVGYGQCALNLSTIEDASLGTYHYMNAQSHEFASLLVTWSGISTSQPDNSLFIIEPAEEVESDYAPTFNLCQKVGDHTPLCFATEIAAIDNVPAYTAAGTVEKDGVKYIALQEAEMPIKAGQPFFLIPEGDYDGEATEYATITPGNKIVTKAGSSNGLTGVFSKTFIEEGTVWVGATEAKAVDNVTSYVNGGSAYMKYGVLQLPEDGDYAELMPISGNPTNYGSYDLDKHAGTEDDPYPVSNATELLALRSVMHTGQMTYVILDEDIDISGMEWTPLNLAENSYGTTQYMNWISFDGRGHTVTGLTCTETGKPYNSFFGILCGSVKNVGFIDCNVSCDASGSGILAGYIGHSIFVDANGNPQTTTVENVWATGKLNIASAYCGGLFGNVGGPTVIKNCYANVDITSGADFVGGLIGRIRSALTLENAYAAGTCPGGGIIGGGQNASTPASTYRNLVVWNNTESNFGSTVDADTKEGISCYDGTNFAALQQTVVDWGRAWYCDMQEGSYPTLAGNGMALLLDIVFNEDGTATDASPMKSAVEILGTAPTTYWSDQFNRYVAKFDAPMGSTPTGVYKVDFEKNTSFCRALANGHSLEMVIKADLGGQPFNVVAKPFSAMQSGGTGFETADVNGKRVVRFNPHVGGDWGRVDSDLTPEDGIYYHILGVWNKQEQKGDIYVNGVLSNTKELPGDFKFASTGRGWFGIGGDPDKATTASNAWCGDIVIARVYNDALTAEEVTALWNDVKGGVGLDGVKANSEQKDAIYTINGIRVQKTQKGVYIINGKTVLVK